MALGGGKASEQPPAPRPEFIRLPKSGSQCPWSGLSRSKLNELILPTPLNQFSPPVSSVSLRHRGQLRAVRLVAFDSLMAYLRQLERQQASAAAAEAATPFPTALQVPTNADGNEPAIGRDRVVMEPQFRKSSVTIDSVCT